MSRLLSRTRWLTLALLALTLGACFKGSTYVATASVKALNNPLGFTATPAQADLNAEIRLLESHEVALRVASMMTEEEKKIFMAAYGYVDSDVEKTKLEDQLLKVRSASFNEQKNVITINVENPNPQIAAAVADYFAQAFIEYIQSLGVEKAARAVEVLKGNMRLQTRAVEAIQAQITALVAKFDLADLTSSTGTDRQDLVAARSEYTRLAGEKAVAEAFLQAMLKNTEEMQFNVLNNQRNYRPVERAGNNTQRKSSLF